VYEKDMNKVAHKVSAISKALQEMFILHVYVSMSVYAKVSGLAAWSKTANGRALCL
jgi:hypothetical protein